MRFTEAGPSVPNELLDSRDAGDVVFLCGAGISIPAGLPDFFKLTVDVADRLGVQPDSQPGRLLEAERQNRLAGGGAAPHGSVSFDRIFTLLVRAFGVGQVEAEVVAVLSVGRRPALGNHRALLDLARGPDGRQRLITTNFDRLFQKAQPRLRSYAPPHFPDLSRRDGFDGVVHLHGMLPGTVARRSDESRGLILSSGDFGRAYLADAWATRFICDLLDRHIVVLLGYSADDPPVRYLLEGLNLSGRIGERRLYAFVAGDAAVVESEWRDRGVTPIPYDPVDHHRHLWDTIDGWAERARDLVAWRERIVELARTPPERLKPFERGQVAALCGSAEGALAFSKATPPPPAEWLCVFDALCRYWKPGNKISYSETPAPEIDPLEAYGLDDDPPRAPEGERNQAAPGIDLLAPLKSDDPVARESSVVSWRGSVAPLNTRLFQMARWIQSVMSSATAAWWAASRGPLHDHLHNQLSWTLDRDDVTFDPVVRQAWRLVLEAHDCLPVDFREGWHTVQAQIRKEGWEARSISDFAKATRPRISVQRSWLHAPVPPLFREMKPHFLGAIAATRRWTANRMSHLGQHLVLALESAPRRKALLTHSEGRVALRAASEALRHEVLFFLRSRATVKGGWERTVVPFFRKVWPRELQFQTPETTRTLVLLLEEVGDRFPEGVSLVADFLVPSPNADMFVFQFGNDQEHGHADLTEQYPLDTLLVLSKIVDEASQRPPYGLADVLSRLTNAAPELRYDERWQRLHRLTFM